MSDPNDPPAVPLAWAGGALKDLRDLPKKVRTGVGRALYAAQIGARSPKAKTMKGFGDAGVIEIVENLQGDTYRAVYTVRFVGRVYVLHVFQKKSTRGIATPTPDLDLIRHRLSLAEEMHTKWLKQ